MPHTNFHLKWSFRPPSNYSAPGRGTGNEMSDRNGFVFFGFIRSNDRPNGRVYSTKGKMQLAGACMDALLLSGYTMDIFHGRIFQRFVKRETVSVVV